MRASTMSELDLRRLPRAGREPARHRGRRHHEHDAQPRDRAPRPRRDEPRHRRRCLDIMVRYATERHTFGKPLAEHGQIQRYIGESYAKTEAMRALIYNVAATVGPARATASAPTPPSSSPRPPPRRSPTPPCRCSAATATAPSTGRALPARRQADRDRRRHARVAPEEHHARPDVSLRRPAGRESTSARRIRRSVSTSRAPTRSAHARSKRMTARNAVLANA